MLVSSNAGGRGSQFDPRASNSISAPACSTGSRQQKPFLVICSFVAAMLLFMPKINLISIQGQTAGIRIDDLLLLPLSLCITAFPYRRAFLFVRFQNIFLLMCLLGLLSVGVNYDLYQRGTVLYVLRYLEYFIFAYLGYFFAQRHSLSRLALTLMTVNGAVMVLQSFRLIGGFTSAEGATSDVSDRAIGLTGGAYEVGMVINICIGMLIADPSISRVRKFFYYWLSFGLILLTGARLPLLAELYLLCVLIFQERRNIFNLLVPLSLAGAVLLGVIYLFPVKAIQRSQNTFSTENLGSLATAYVGAPVPATGNMEQHDETFDQTEDVSWLYRTSKWSTSFKVWQSNIFTVLFGVGPGFAGAALDGGWLRILTEQGLIGFIVFIIFLRRLSILHAGMAMAVVCLAINMLMIDVHIASRVMTLFLFCGGAYAGLAQQRHYAMVEMAAGIPSIRTLV